MLRKLPCVTAHLGQMVLVACPHGLAFTLQWTQVWLQLHLWFFTWGLSLAVDIWHMAARRGRNLAPQGAALSWWWTNWSWWVNWDGWALWMPRSGAELGSIVVHCLPSLLCLTLPSLTSVFLGSPPEKRPLISLVFASSGPLLLSEGYSSCGTQASHEVTSLVLEHRLQ